MLVIKQKKHLKRLRTAQAQLYSILGTVKLQGPPAVGGSGPGGGILGRETTLDGTLMVENITVRLSKPTR